MSKLSRLLTGSIIGIVDSYGSVDSRIIDRLDEENHAEVWPGNTHCRWRWDRRSSLHWFVSDYKPNEEEQDHIRRHLTRKYGIHWLENGYFDEEKFNQLANKS